MFIAKGHPEFGLLQIIVAFHLMPLSDAVNPIPATEGTGTAAGREHLPPACSHTHTRPPPPMPSPQHSPVLHSTSGTEHQWGLTHIEKNFLHEHTLGTT